MLLIFIVLKNPLPSTGYEPMNLVSSGKYANHYTSEDDCDLKAYNICSVYRVNIDTIIK
jgi:hypothetical protein